MTIILTHAWNKTHAWNNDNKAAAFMYDDISVDVIIKNTWFM